MTKRLTIISLVAVVLIATGAGLAAWTQQATDWKRVAPFSGLTWSGQDADARVLVDGAWYDLQAVNDIPMHRIEAFAESEYGDRQSAEKRMVEDLYEVLLALNVDDPSSVSLTVKDADSGKVSKLLNVEMTHEKRDAAYALHGNRGTGT